MYYQAIYCLNKRPFNPSRCSWIDFFTIKDINYQLKYACSFLMMKRWLQTGLCPAAIWIPNDTSGKIQHNICNMPQNTLSSYLHHNIDIGSYTNAVFGCQRPITILMTLGCLYCMSNNLPICRTLIVLQYELYVCHITKLFPLVMLLSTTWYWGTFLQSLKITGLFKFCTTTHSLQVRPLLFAG